MEQTPVGRNRCCALGVDPSRQCQQRASDRVRASRLLPICPDRALAGFHRAGTAVFAYAVVGLCASAIVVAGAGHQRWRTRRRRRKRWQGRRWRGGRCVLAEREARTRNVIVGCENDRAARGHDVRRVGELIEASARADAVNLEKVKSTFQRGARVSWLETKHLGDDGNARNRCEGATRARGVISWVIGAGDAGTAAADTAWSAFPGINDPALAGTDDEEEYREPSHLQSGVSDGGRCCKGSQSEILIASVRARRICVGLVHARDNETTPVATRRFGRGVGIHELAPVSMRWMNACEQSGS